MSTTPDLVLVLGATGTVGSRTLAELRRRGVPTRGASRSTPLPFDWDDPRGWDAVLAGVRAVFLLAPVGVVDPAGVMLRFIAQASEHGVRRCVLLSASAVASGSPGVGRVAALLPEMVPEWTVLRPSWFMQNLVAESHYMGRELIEHGRLLTSTADAKIAFVDAGDVAAVAAWALVTSEPPQAELVITGPQAISYDEVAAVVTGVAGREIRHEPATRERVIEMISASGIPAEFAAVLAGLEDDIRSGSEDRTTDVVRRATGRPARSFAEFAADHADRWRRR